jgi:predicted ATPase with chaperone activity
MLDRIDIHVEVPRLDSENLADKRNVEDSKTIRAGCKPPMNAKSSPSCK